MNLVSTTGKHNGATSSPGAQRGQIVTGEEEAGAGPLLRGQRSNRKGRLPQLSSSATTEENQTYCSELAVPAAARSNAIDTASITPGRPGDAHSMTGAGAGTRAAGPATAAAAPAPPMTPGGGSMLPRTALYCSHCSSSCEGNAMRKPPRACSAIARVQAWPQTDTCGARRVVKQSTPCS